MGLHTNAILAGLGVGGLAVALAAQKTIRKSVWSRALISDRPVLVGDFFSLAAIGNGGRYRPTLHSDPHERPHLGYDSQFHVLHHDDRKLVAARPIWFHPTLRSAARYEFRKVREMMDAVNQFSAASFGSAGRGSDSLYKNYRLLVGSRNLCLCGYPDSTNT